MKYRGHFSWSKRPQCQHETMGHRECHPAPLAHFATRPQFPLSSHFLASNSKVAFSDLPTQRLRLLLIYPYFIDWPQLSPTRHAFLLACLLAISSMALLAVHAAVFGVTGGLFLCFELSCYYNHANLLTLIAAIN